MRLFRTALLLAGFVALGYGLRAHFLWKPAPCFDQVRMGWRAEWEALIAGDSRGLWGISPEALATHAKTRRIGNYSFRGNCFNEPYLHAVRAAIRLSPGNSFVVLALSPMSVAERRAHPCPFDSMTADLYMEGRLLRALPAFGVVRLAELRERFRESSKVTQVRGQQSHGCREDGWVAFRPKRRDPKAEIPFYKRVYLPGARIKTERVQLLSEFARKWVREGIAIYGLRPPTTKEMAVVEERALHYERSGVDAALLAAGATWLDVDPSCYPTYDGSHLEETVAIRFSHDIGRVIAMAERDRQAFRGKRIPVPCGSEAVAGKALQTTGGAF